jgi:2-keto-myo-inositol isomerase
MKISISQATTLPAPFAEDLKAFGDVDWQAAEIWMTKLEQYLESHSSDEVHALLKSAKVQPVAAAYQGGLLLSQAEKRQESFAHFRKRLEICQAFEIPVLVVMADVGHPADATSWQRAAVSLKQAAQWAAAFNVRLAFEFRADGFCTNLATAIDFVAQCQEPNLGICLDLYHYYKGPSKAEDLERLTPHNLFHVHVCDVAGVPREWMTDADRIMPGDGDFQLIPILSLLRRIGYEGYLSLELLNPVLWQMKLTQVAELGLMAMNRLTETK